MDYDFGNKRQWRRTVWSQLWDKADPDRLREGVFIYLGGKSNHDRDLLLSKGVRPHNIISVDWDERVAKEVRGRGNLCIVGNIFDVLIAFPDSVPIAAACLDVCSSVTEFTAGEMTDVIMQSNFPVAINLMRGREQSKNVMAVVDDLRQSHERGKGLSDNVWDKSVFKGNFGSRYFNNTNWWKHRGIVLLDIVFNVTRRAAKTLWFIPDAERIAIADMLRKISPFLYSYKSASTHIFDTLVVSPLPMNLEGTHDSRLKRRLPLSGLLMDSFLTPQEKAGFPELNPLRRQISAVLAHRTMRMRGGA